MWRRRRPPREARRSGWARAWWPGAARKVSDPRAGGWGRGGEPLPPARPEAPGDGGPEPAAPLRGLLPVAPPLRLGPPGYVTRDLPFPLRHGAATPALPPALRRQATPGAHGPAFPGPAAGAATHSLLRRRLAGHSFTRAFECSLPQRSQNVARAPGRGVAVLRPGLTARSLYPGFSRSLARRHAGGSVFLPFSLLFICLPRFQDTCPKCVPTGAPCTLGCAVKITTEGSMERATCLCLGALPFLSPVWKAPTFL